MEEKFNRVGQERNPHYGCSLTPYCPRKLHLPNVASLLSQKCPWFWWSLMYLTDAYLLPHLSLSQCTMKAIIPTGHSRMTSMTDRNNTRHLTLKRNRGCYTGQFQGGPPVESNRPHLMWAEHRRYKLVFWSASDGDHQKAELGVGVELGGERDWNE